MRAAKACPHPSCPNLQPCPEHERKPWAGSARDRGAQRISGSRRQARARYVLMRDETICALCGLPGAQEADHRIPLAHGGADDLTNLQAVHKDCHTKKTAREARGGNP